MAKNRYRLVKRKVAVVDYVAVLAIRIRIPEARSRRRSSTEGNVG